MCALLTFSLIPALPAGAEPVPADPNAPISEPDTAAGARAAWLAAEETAEALNDDVLQAGIDVETAAAAVVAADAAVVAADAAAISATTAATDAQALVAGYDEQLDEFANASFRGARISSLSSLLTAESPDEYLDSVVALDRVAGANADLLQQAADAKTAADAAVTEVAAAQITATNTQQQAVTAQATALATQSVLATTQAEFDAQIAEYETLYNQLTEEERLAALAAEEDRLARDAAAAAAANPDDAAAQAAAAGSESVSVIAAGEVTGPLAPAPNAAAQAAVEAALSKVGSKYVWGAAGPNQFDCSGLTSWAWKQAGVTIPRTSGMQSGLPVVALDQLRPGDLITFYSPVSHVAMYIGDGQMVQASTASKPVYVTAVAKGGPNPVGHRVG